MRLHHLQHVTHEGMANIEAWARRRGFSITESLVSRGDALPDTDAFDWLVVMGGPMSVYEEDRYPWLKPEKRFIREAMDAGKVVIGVCLGAQLLADVLGAEVRPHTHREVGWFEAVATEDAARSAVFSKLPAKYPVFHWHGDTFDIPDSALHVATGDSCPAQAFEVDGRVFALQYHVESNRPNVQAIIDHDDHEQGMLVTGGPYVQTAEAIMGNDEGFEQVKVILDTMLDAIADATG